MCHLYRAIMNSRRRDSRADNMCRATTSRRALLTAGGAVAIGALSGCLSQVASSVTNTGSSPAAVFTGTDWNDDETVVTGMGWELAPGSPHVARLTPTLVERIELEGWVTSSAVMAQNHNSSRSNRPSLSPTLRDGDGDSDGDGVGDGSEEDDELAAYLGGKPIVAERFTVCLPDAEVPGGNGSIREAVTPERLIAYLTDGDGGDLLSKADSKKSGVVEGGGDCDDDDSTVYPGAVCGTSPHFSAEVSGPVATGGGLVAERDADGHVIVTNSPPSAEEGASVVVCPAEGEPFEPEGLDAWAKKMDDVPVEITQQGRLNGLTVAQVMVQPPGCPRAFPALMYMSRGLNDGQLIYSGGWVIDDAALYEDSVTVLTLAESARVVGIECCFDYDSDGDGFSDVLARAGLSERERRGAQLAVGTVDELVASGLLSESAGEDVVVRKRPGREGSEVSLEVTGDEYGFVTNVPVDAPVLHLVNAASASNEVKFKAGAELSKSVN